MSDPGIDPEILYQHEPHWRRQGWTGLQIIAAHHLLLGRPAPQIVRDPTIIELAGQMSDHLGLVHAAQERNAEQAAGDDDQDDLETRS